jgi:membrane associated rhomboid family serine protease
MQKHILAGVIVGGCFGVVIAAIAMSSALPAGGVVALAAALDGIMAGLGGGWLIGVTVAEGTFEQEELGSEPERVRLAEAQGSVG